MKKTVLIEKTAVFTRIAILHDDQLIATYIDSNLEPDVQDKVLVGQVDKVVKNLNAAFIDYGDEKKGLLHLSQIPQPYKEKIHQGLRLPIQIVKQNIGEKGHKVTGKISLKGKYLICLPFETSISVSKKIKNQKLRIELKEMLGSLLTPSYGFIVRTHAQHVALEEIKEDADRLIDKASHIMGIRDYLAKGSVLYEEPPMAVQIVAEHIHLSQEVEVVCNDEAFVRFLQDTFENYLVKGYPLHIKRIDKKEEIFQIYDIQKEINELQNRKIWLKNGGNIMIDYTEALTVVDVNSAKAVLSHHHGKAVRILNQLAIEAAFLQMLRRNVSGIIIIDLIEMQGQEDKDQVYLYAKNLIIQLGDKRTTVFPITELGLLQISRSKKYSSIPSKILRPCSACKYIGQEPSLAYQAYLIEKKIKYAVYQTTNKEVKIKCSEDILEFFVLHDLKRRLEDEYKLEIKLLKLEKEQKNVFLCTYS